jgi:hypothetical protein
MDCESVEVPALWARHSGNKHLLTTHQLAKKGLAWLTGSKIYCARTYCQAAG